ncbi:MAG: hypothetical protein COU07_02815 [Candidatus Harrisonbacteria bacterium CG10_big_fil_rev_8_21_14_0_10_40_38]|uniref:FAD/NAD(P)-binding domain-containing protein n=1 Tax=Candidatus Harrisonbacteria bacterium CG10_big_fil_rev_8_21_14_0_10_40_38 TaxID=1974583 RepID=A0A2H0URX8_9BACT|nr:MAG: hypothetical protein COU07_02815 [Candidatus Harrisonbacteria bacterium CG10_big_fil_rev_8_21_14_0_10_40_38]
MNDTKKRIVIVGGGFGGVSTALKLSKLKVNASITLVTDKPHFEYYAGLYRVVTGKSPLEVCIPLRDIFDGTSVEVVIDKISEVHLSTSALKGASGSRYLYDYLVLALGSETAYFNIPGLEKSAFGFKSITEALRLKQHLHEAFESCEKQESDKKVCAAHIVLVGGGASGTELAAELAQYTKILAKKHKLDPSLITIDLIEEAPRILPILPESVSKVVTQRLRRLGVNVMCNRTVIKEDVETLYLKDMNVKTKTVIWTAGAMPNRLYRDVKGFQLDKKGRVVVDEYLQAVNVDNVFVIGDAASVMYAGMAQTAIRHGEYVGSMISVKLKNQEGVEFIPRPTDFAIPVGTGWAATIWMGMHFYGILGWWLRRAADLRYFFSILPLSKALRVFTKGKTLCETCAICAPDES